MRNPTEEECVLAFRKAYGGQIGGHERAFFAFLHIARSHGVGYGFMRQAIGLAWRLADPVGYIDDARLLELADGDS